MARDYCMEQHSSRTYAYKDRHLPRLGIAVLPAPRTMPGTWHEGKKEGRGEEGREGQTQVSVLVELKIQ